MELDDVQRNWEAFGEIDPLWAILTHPSKKDNRWNPEEFFATGQTEIDWFMDSIAALSVSVKREHALDFGCGVGRLTQALCRHFQRCDGVDIASSMISLARTYNHFGDRCQYHVNDAGDLRMFEDNRFDFICSNLVLQHIPPKYSTRYIRDFVRVLKPNGVAVFQVPSEIVLPSETVAAPAGPTRRRPSIERINWMVTAMRQELLSRFDIVERLIVPDAIFKAKITVSPSTLTTVSGAPIRLVASVRNTSTRVWPARSGAPTRYKFRLGNHWLTAFGNMKQRDDGRTDLVEDLEPENEVALPLTVKAPVEPGEYILELDMVQEYVAWFKERGSPTCRVPVRVAAAPDSAAPAAPAEPLLAPTAAAPKQPEMGMYGLPRSTVSDLVTGQGARLLHVEEYASAVPEFVSYRYYYVSK